MKLRLLVLIALTTLSLAACSVFRRPEPKYGREFNAERMKIGLPIIEEDWQLSRSDKGRCSWVTSRREDKARRQPVHFSKDVNYRTGMLLSETDLYFGSEDWFLDGETYREELTVTYSFRVDDYASRRRLGWSAWLTDRDGSREISLEEAEQVLARWGIQRLSYGFPPKD